MELEISPPGESSDMDDSPVRFTFRAAENIALLPMPGGAIALPSFSLDESVLPLAGGSWARSARGPRVIT